jgi:hypothetical protein
MELYWALYTWMLFHALIEKSSEEFYKIKYKEIFNLIRSVCLELPCPVCRRHAIEYLKNINIQHLTTREMFREMLYNFHNNVNARLGKPLYGYNNLVTYNNYNMAHILVHFKRFFSRRYGGILQIGLSSNQNKRISVAINVMTWFKAHWSEFNH